jgi:hypothetical protein
MIQVPDLAQRKSLLALLLQHKQLHPDLSVGDMALHTASYTARDLTALVSLSTRHCLERAELAMREGAKLWRGRKDSHGETGKYVSCFLL